MAKKRANDRRDKERTKLREEKAGTEKICFVDSHGREMFQIPDGGAIKMSYGNGDENYALCRKADDTHTEIDGQMWENRQFAAWMEQVGIDVAPA